MRKIKVGDLMYNPPFSDKGIAFRLDEYNFLWVWWFNTDERDAFITEYSPSQLELLASHWKIKRPTP
jgi:hypothetical protein